MPNRLANETSPYLLQHKDNPVDWYPWGEEALARAREEDKPILLSIGYSACHWCHVMERESFEDPRTAELMNELFVPVKLDREERPDLDAIYMEACQAMTGSGGWPLNVFLTPEQVPFYAGTYFPPEQRGGMPSWQRVLVAVAEAWNDKRDEIRAGAGRVVRRLAGGALLQPSDEPIEAEKILDTAVERLRTGHDRVNGGFGGAPKFPPADALELLMRRGERFVVDNTLRKMASGGMYDQIGGGFARYSVDERWLVPHFEKMLYDNGLLARAYLHGWQVGGDGLFREVCEETLDWALREMRASEGGFYSALDADSEGVEGKFYVWSVDELRSVLGDDADAAIEWFGATAHGNFEGANILTRGSGDPPPELPSIKQRLYDVRKDRVWPGLDDKRLTSWNGLMIAALADAGAVLERPDYVDAAVACAEFVLGELRDSEGRLLRTWKDGEAKLNAYLEDHAFMLEALVLLYEATFDPRWFAAARETADTMIERYADDDRGGFFETSSDHEQLVARRKDLEDNPIPSGNSSAAYGLLRLAALSGEYEYERRAVSVFRLLHKLMPQHPQAFPHLLQALDFHAATVKEIALAGEGDATAPLARVVRSRFRPHVVLAGGEPDGVPLLEGRTPVDGRPAAYVCERFACRRPVTEPGELEALLRSE